MGCRFSTHATKSHLGQLILGAYYVKENEAHAYSELSLSPEAAALAPPELLASRNNTPGWKAIIRQLEDQLAAGAGNPDEAAEQAAGLVQFAERVMKTPYATTPMRVTLGRVHKSEDNEEEESLASIEAREQTLLQRLEDSVGHLCGELGVCSPNSRCITLHGGV